MSIRDLVSLANVCTTSGALLVTLGNNYYKASATWKKFQRKVKQLSREHDVWAAGISDLDLPLDQYRSLTDSLNEAKLQLDLEIAKVSKMKRAEENINLRCCPCSSWNGWSIHMAVFPARLASSIETLTDAFDDILASLMKEEKVRAVLENIAIARPISPPFHMDERYVHLRHTETAIRSALGNSMGPALVLLHGGPGQGKSTVSRYIALHYNAVVMPNRVVYMECGPLADLEAKQMELLQLLGSNVISFQEKESSSSGTPFLDASLNFTQGHEEGRQSRTLCSGLTASLEKQYFRSLEVSQGIMVRARLSARLKEREWLVVLDDVMEEDFLEGMFNDTFRPRNVRCLVTSQRADLCHNLKSLTTVIQIEDIAIEDSRKLFGVHLGLPHGQIPPDLEVLADKMIGAVDANPLAIATIARAIDVERSDKREWKLASKDTLRLLKLKDILPVLSKRYPRSFWASMGLSFDSLAEEGKKLLVLVQMCEGPAVPEEIIELLHRRARPGEPFSKLRRYLENRNLVKITLDDTSPGMGQQRSWSVHSLLTKFIDEEKKSAKEEMFTSVRRRCMSFIDRKSTIQLSEIQPEETSINQFDDLTGNTLAALYLEDDFARRIASEMPTPFRNFNGARKRAIEPIIRLMLLDSDIFQANNIFASARQVLLRFIYAGTLDDKCTSDLLKLRVSTLAVLHTIQYIADISETTALHHGVLTSLVSLIQLGERSNEIYELEPDATIQEEAWKATEALGVNDANGLLISKSQEFFEAGLEVLSRGNSRLKGLALSALASITLSVQDQCFPLVGGNLQSMVEKLVDCWIKGDDSLLRQCALRVIGNLLAGIGRRKRKTFNLLLVCFKKSGVAYTFQKSLQESLAEEGNPCLQANAAWVVANVTSGDNKMKQGILKSTNLVKMLVDSLLKDDNANLQCDSAWALANLASTDDDSKFRLIKAASMLQRLVKCLTKDANPTLQENAALALGNLADGNTEIKQEMLKSPGLLEMLVKALADDINPSLQIEAAQAFINLAHGDSKIKQRMVKSSQVLEALANALSKDDIPSLQSSVALGIANLADGGGETHEAILKCPHLLQGIVNALSKDVNPHLQANAALTLAYLAEGDDETKQAILQFPCLLKSLANSSADDGNPSLQKCSLWAVVDLADGNTKIKQEIVNSAVVLGKLVKTLSKDGMPNLQRLAAQGLINLAGGDFEVRREIIKYTSTLTELIKCLGKEHHPSLQASAALVLANLAETDTKTKRMILESHCLLERLVKALATNDNPSLQMNAAQLLANLAAGDSQTKQRLLEFQNLLETLLEILPKDDRPLLQRNIAQALAHFGDLLSERVRESMKASQLMDSFVDVLGRLSADHRFQETQKWAASVLMSMDPTKVPAEMQKQTLEVSKEPSQTLMSALGNPCSIFWEKGLPYQVLADLSTRDNDKNVDLVPKLYPKNEKRVHTNADQSIRRKSCITDQPRYEHASSSLEYVERKFR